MARRKAGSREAGATPLAERLSRSAVQARLKAVPQRREVERRTAHLMVEQAELGAQGHAG